MARLGTRYNVLIKLKDSFMECEGSKWQEEIYKVPNLIAEDRPGVFTWNKNSEYDGGHCKKLRVGRLLGWGAVEVKGAVGGVVVFWDKRALELNGMEVGDFSISCQFKCIGGWFYLGILWGISSNFKEGKGGSMGWVRGCGKILGVYVVILT